MIVDAQIHLWKEEFLSPTARTFIKNMFNTMQNDDFEPILNATPEKYIEEMEQAGIEKAIISTSDWGFGSNISIIKYNNFIAEVVKDYSDIFKGFCGVDPRRKNATEILQKGINAGLCGLKIYPGTGFRPDDEICMPLYNMAAENDLIVSIHSGFTTSPYSIELGNPLFLENILETFPSLKVIASSQLGFPFVYNLAAIMRKYKNLYTDYAPMNLNAPEVGIAQNILAIKVMIDERHQIMFATYWPFSSGRVKEWVDRNAKIKLPAISRLIGVGNVTKEDREYIMGLTASKLFKI